MKNKKNKVITLLLAIIMLIGTIAPAVFAMDFQIDDRIQKLVDDGYITGYENGSLGLERSITRAEFATIVARALDLDELTKSLTSVRTGFSDVAVGSWYNGYIGAIKSKKIISGYPDGTFKPDRNMTYDEAMAIMTRVLLTPSEIEVVNKGQWPMNYFFKANELGILEGVYGVNLGETAVRREVFLMLANVVKKLEDKNTIEVEALVLDNGVNLKLAILKDVNNFKKGDILGISNKENSASVEVGIVYKLKVNSKSQVVGIEKSSKANIVSDKIEKNKKGFKIGNKTYSVDSIFQLNLNGKDIEYKKFPDVVNDGKATIYNGELIYINAYNFEEVLFTQEIKSNRIYAIDISGKETVLTSTKDTSVSLIENGETKEVGFNDIKKGDILHINKDRRNVNILILRDSLEGKLSEIDAKKNTFKLNDKEVKLSSSGTLLIQDRRYVPIKDVSNLKSLSDGKIKVYLSITGDVLFIEADKNVSISTTVIIESIEKDKIGVFTEFEHREYLYVTEYTELLNEKGRPVFSDRYSKDRIEKITNEIKVGDVLKIVVDARGDIEEIEILRKTSGIISYIDFEIIEINGRDEYLSEDFVAFIDEGSRYSIISIDDLDEMFYRNKNLKIEGIIFESDRIIEAIVIEGETKGIKNEILSIVKDNLELLNLSESYEQNKEIKSLRDKIVVAVSNLDKKINNIGNKELIKERDNLKSLFKTLTDKLFDITLKELKDKVLLVEKSNKIYNKESLKEIKEAISVIESKKDKNFILVKEITSILEMFDEFVYETLSELDKNIEELKTLTNANLLEVKEVLARSVFNEDVVNEYKLFLDRLSNEIPNIKTVEEVSMWKAELNKRYSSYKNERFNIEGIHENLIKVFHLEEKINVAKQLLAKKDNANLKASINSAEKFTKSLKAIKEAEKINMEKLEEINSILRDSLVEASRDINLSEIKDANLLLILKDGDATRISLIGSGEIDKALALNEILLELRAYGVVGNVEKIAIDSIVDEISNLLKAEKQIVEEINVEEAQGEILEDIKD